MGTREMKYLSFKKKLQGYPYFTTAIFGALAGSEKTLYNQVNKWVKEGKVVRLRKGLFTLNDDERRVGISKKLIANILYSPSYISLEYALSHYGMIPEAVYAVTSLSTKKTQKFSNRFGEFLYRNIKRDAFFGFEALKDEFGFDCLIASPEKALMDYLYLNVEAASEFDESFIEESLRLQNIERLDFRKMTKFAEKMKSKKLLKFVRTLKGWVKK